MNEILSQQDFDTIIGKGVTLLDFNAPWCAPCRAQEPILEKLAAEYKGKASIAAMNIDKNNEIAGKLGIQSIPTLIVFKNGKEIQRLVGLQSKDILADILDNLLN
ncbi:MAG: thioredoxin [Deltaproteobacteria bacterium]|nr:MAG: thioredoxin [Deltaproteobacteria bacterium]